MGRIKLKKTVFSGKPVNRDPLAAPRKFSDQQLAHYHKEAFKNERYLEGAGEAGCFCCLTIFPPSKIEEWWDEGPSRTAVCPWCDVDSVLLPEPKSAIDPALLVEMQAKYFQSEATSLQLPEDLRDWYSLMVKRRGFED
jgi:hypothetical protein